MYFRCLNTNNNAIQRLNDICILNGNYDSLVKQRISRLIFHHCNVRYVARVLFQSPQTKFYICNFKFASTTLHEHACLACNWFSAQIEVFFFEMEMLQMKVQHRRKNTFTEMYHHDGDEFQCFDVSYSSQLKYSDLIKILSV